MRYRQTRSSERSQSLFERIRSDDLEEKSPIRDPIEARIFSIKENLIRLLNSRQGGSDSTPGYGLSDFNDASVGSSDMLRIISNDIRNTIKKYEPRVTDVSVSFDRGAPGGLELFFNVSVKTVIHKNDEQITIDLVLREGRSFALR